MQKQLILGIFVLVYMNVVSGQRVNLGACPRYIKTVQNFDIEAYLGTWYEYSKYPFAYEIDGRCVKHDYETLSENKISVLATQFSSLNVQTSTDGVAKIVDPGKLSVRFNGLAALLGLTDYWVLATDYENYAVVYSCKNLADAHAKNVWILTRERDPAEDVVTDAEDVLISNGLSLDPLIVTDQTDCE
uniref:Apolipoprotein D n=1 Tax=Ceratitis capitata TaxID=7213 RepID=W8BMB3_CERCA